MSEKDTIVKKLVLDYLQENALDLRRKFPTLIEASLGEEPARLILTFASDQPAPTVEDLKETFAFPVDIGTRESKAVVVTDNVEDTTDHENVVAVETKSEEDEIYHRTINDDGARILGVKEAVGPHSVKPVDRDALEQWKKRHSGVKVASDE